MQSNNRAHKRVLIADDEPGIRELLEEILTLRGIEVEVAASGSEAIAALERHSFDLAILDLLMPGTPGSHVARYIKSNTPDMPIVIITGSDVETIEKSLQGISITKVIRKPFEMEEISTVVTKLLD